MLRFFVDYAHSTQTQDAEAYRTWLDQFETAFQDIDPHRCRRRNYQFDLVRKLSTKSGTGYVIERAVKLPGLLIYAVGKKPDMPAGVIWTIHAPELELWCLTTIPSAFQVLKNRPR